MNKIFENRQIIEKIVLIIALLIWLIIVLFNPYLKMFNLDEMWALIVGRDLNLFEILKFTHYEGHLCLWYLVLKPFAYIFSNDVPPLFIKYINLFFVFIAMIVMLFFSRINIFIKLLILFSHAFLCVYPVFARPYGLAIMLIFILTAMYKNRLKNPIIYSILIFLTMQTCFNAVLISLMFSACFVYDLIKENIDNYKKYLVPVSIVLFSIIMVGAQWIPFHTCKFAIEESGTNFLLGFLVHETRINTTLYIVMLLITFIPILLSAVFFNISNILKQKRVALFLLFIFPVGFVFFLTFTCRIWHLYFLFYIYIIVLYWLAVDNFPEYSKQNKKGFVSFTTFIIALSIIFNFSVRKEFDYFLSLDFINHFVTVFKNVIPEKSTVYMDMFLCEPIIYYYYKDYDLKNQFGEKIPSYKAYIGFFQNEYLKPSLINTKKGENAYFITKFGYNPEDFSFCEIEYEVFDYHICKIPKQE